VLIIRRSKLYYTASGIVTPVGGRPVHRLRESGIITPVGGRPVHRLRESGIITPVGGRAVHMLRGLRRDSYAFLRKCVEFMSCGLQKCVQNVASSVQGLTLNDSVWTVRWCKNFSSVYSVQCSVEWR
jgi:hypothetical protein